MLRNGQKIIYDDKQPKSAKQLLEAPSVSDMFLQPYVKGTQQTPKKGEDPGRIRNENLMKQIYGNTEREVRQHLTSVTWCPRLVGQKLLVTTVNNVHLQLQKVSEELDRLPELKKYLEGASTFNWRTISGTNRLSTHSFGTAIDLNVKFSNYWQWDCRCKNEDKVLEYKNKIPQQIVQVFEQYGFIWGGNWYHYDTMHFEYRPDLLLPSIVKRNN